MGSRNQPQSACTKTTPDETKPTTFKKNAFSLEEKVNARIFLGCGRLKSRSGFPFRASARDSVPRMLNGEEGPLLPNRQPVKVRRGCRKSSK